MVPSAVIHPISHNNCFFEEISRKNHRFFFLSNWCGKIISNIESLNKVLWRNERKKCEDRYLKRANMNGPLLTKYVFTVHQHPAIFWSLFTKEFFRTWNVLPFSCTHLVLWRGKEEGLKLWLTIWEERKLDFSKGISLFQLKSM